MADHACMVRARRRDPGFTLLEALAAAALLALIVAALSQAVVAAHMQSDDALHRARATDLGEAMMEEVLAHPYRDPDAGSSGGEEDGDSDAEDGDGTSSRSIHVSFTIQSGSDTIGNSLNSIEIDMDNSSRSSFTGTSWDNVATVGVDKDGDGTIETDLYPDRADWIIREQGSRLKATFGGSAYTNPQAGHTIVLALENVSNGASTGTFDGEAQTSGDGNWQHVNVVVTDSSDSLGPESDETGRADFDDLDDYDGFTMPAGSLRDATGTRFPAAYQDFDCAVTVTSAALDPIGLGGAQAGRRVRVTVTEPGGRSWTFRCFVPEPAS